MEIPKIYVKKIENVDHQITMNIEATMHVYPLDVVSIGVDPGVTNIGIAKIIPDKVKGSALVLLHHIYMEREKNPVERMMKLCMYMHERIYVTGGEILTIEGASYGKHYRQVELAEARAVIAMWGAKKGLNVGIVPPNTIRKVAFGSAKVKNPWEDIPDDCAAALGCAIYGYRQIS